MDKAWVSMGATFAFLHFIQNLLHFFLPDELSFALRRLGVRLYHALFNHYVDFTVDEFDGAKSNELYAAALLHLSDKTAGTTRQLSLVLPKNASSITCILGEHERVLDAYEGSKIWWEFRSSELKQNMRFSWEAIPHKRRSLHMHVHQRDRDKIMSGYLPHLLANAEALKLKQRDRLLYTNLKPPSSYGWESGRKLWDSVPFKHPATFHSLALDPTQKQKIIDDLQDFADGEQFYKDAGRAWKRGYLLYGPPGTGKSSMIAAMANFLEYDVYDLELTEVASNAVLRRLLLNTSNKAVIVIEDIDCSLDLSGTRKKKAKVDAGTRLDNNEKGSELTLSGLLNFTDGLWSSCGSERIFVFTTNHVEKLDAALLRSGRMDMHIHLSYCGFEAFKVLAKNYLKLDNHALFEEVRAAMQEEGVQITPAEVSEVMTREKRDVEQVLCCLIKEMRIKKREGRTRGGGRHGVGGGRHRGGRCCSTEEIEEEEKEVVEAECSLFAKAEDGKAAKDEVRGEKNREAESFVETEDAKGAKPTY